MKMLEIGLGCNHMTGAGASVALWKKLFPEIELWEAEFDAKCVNQTRAEGKLDCLNLLVGDQNDINTLDNWIETSGGAFDPLSFDSFDIQLDSIRAKTNVYNLYWCCIRLKKFLE